MIDDDGDLGGCGLGGGGFSSGGGGLGGGGLCGLQEGTGNIHRSPSSAYFVCGQRPR